MVRSGFKLGVVVNRLTVDYSVRADKPPLLLHHVPQFMPQMLFLARRKVYLIALRIHDLLEGAGIEIPETICRLDANGRMYIEATGQPGIEKLHQKELPRCV